MLHISISVSQFILHFNMPQHARWSKCKLYSPFRINSTAVPFAKHIAKRTLSILCDTVLSDPAVCFSYELEIGLLQCVISLNCLCWFPLLSTIHELLGGCHVRLTEASGEAINTNSCLEGTVSGISDKHWTVSIQMLYRGVVDTYYRCNMNIWEWNEGMYKNMAIFNEAIHILTIKSLDKV